VIQFSMTLPKNGKYFVTPLLMSLLWIRLVVFNT
jgi:hypothetical protein